jgi:two-component system chemotaxis sensor kinase CheA
VVQYRGEIMPLVHISQVLPERRMSMRYEEAQPSDSLQVVVHRMGERRVGLVVDRIQDIVDERLELAPASRSCVLGSVVVHGRVTEVIDLPAVLNAAGINESSLLAAAATW